MKLSFLRALGLLVGLTFGAYSSSAACACEKPCKCGDTCACADSEIETVTAAAKPADAGHPLHGVVQSVLAERTALLVKHDEIPGVMKAMTMMFRVPAEVLEKVKAGDTITAQLHHTDNVWHLTDVAVVKPN